MTQLAAADSRSQRKTTTLEVLEGSAKLAETSGSTAARVREIGELPRVERGEHHFIVASRFVEPASVQVRFQRIAAPILLPLEGGFFESLNSNAGSVGGLVEIGTVYLGEINLFGISPHLTHYVELLDPIAAVEASSANVQTGLDGVWRQIAELFDEDAVAVGEPHPAEPILTSLVGSSGFASGFRSAYDAEPALRRSLVLSIGRLPLSAEQQTEVREVIAKALKDPSLQVREAAVRALETLDSIARELLASYDERVQWLREYAERVLRRLSR